VPQIGPLEILVVAVVALIVFGPEKLPDLARKVGRTASELRRIANEAKAELQTDLSLEDDEPPPRSRPRSRPSSESRASSPSRDDGDSAPDGKEGAPAEAGATETSGDPDGAPKEG
jgi:sec-independent protein translocase protein TatB